MSANGTETPRREAALAKLRFQNYTPRAEQLKKYSEEGVDPSGLLEQITESQEELLKSTNRKYADPALDLDNLIPRKSNWDMKRHLASKLEVLEQKTQKAVLKLAHRKALEDGNLDGALGVLDEPSDEEG